MIQQQIAERLHAEDDTGREAKLRRLAKRRGYLIRKDRARSINGDHFGDYMVVDADRNFIVLGSRFDATLDDIEEWLE